MTEMSLLLVFSIQHPAEKGFPESAVWTVDYSCNYTAKVEDMERTTVPSLQHV